MKKEIREVDKERGILQVTTTDERWYCKQETNKETGLPQIKYVPSVTWIAEYYPKGIAFYKWLANKGWDETEAIKEAAADKGSKVHKTIENMFTGEEIKIDYKAFNPKSGEDEELTLEEYDCLVAFADWFNTTKPQVIAAERVVFNDEHNYAGTVDLLCKIDGNLYIVDFKTSQGIWPSHGLQLSAYKHAFDKVDCKLAILQLGYRRNSKRYKFTEVEDKFDLFLGAQKIWANETKGISPKQRDYPLSIKLNITKENDKDNNKSKK